MSGHRAKSARLSDSAKVKTDTESNNDPPEEQTLNFLTAVTPEDCNERDTCKTFIFRAEGHTLGNALRFVIANYHEVAFCAYTLPHPSENVMHFRIQTVPGVSPEDILQRGLHDLLKLSEVVLEKFELAVKAAPPIETDPEDIVVPTLNIPKSSDGKRKSKKARVSEVTEELEKTNISMKETTKESKSLKTEEEKSNQPAKIAVKLKQPKLENEEEEEEEDDEDDGPPEFVDLVDDD